MPELLAAAPLGSYLGPYGRADVPGTELIRNRVTQVIPTKYAAALVHRDGVAPATAYQELAGMLEADGTTEALMCSPGFALHVPQEEAQGSWQ